MQTGMTKGVNENESDECTRNNIFCDLLTSLGVDEKTAMDDACRYGYLVPSNMFASVVLGYLAEYAADKYHDEEMAKEALTLKKEIEMGIDSYAVRNLEGIGETYVYETDGYGNDVWMDEAKLGAGGRFGAGLPAVGDGQMLFLQTAIAKMKDSSQGGSKIAIIHNGSPLFTGDAGSGPSEIRKYILEHDMLEAIIALPNDIFYNTGIATYIWVLSNKKEKRRKGKVQLINANGMFEKRRKSLGNKRNDIPKHYIDEITQIYADFTENEVSKIFDNEDFGYSKIVVERPQKDENGNSVLKGGKSVPNTNLRDTENVPLKEDIGEYFKREVLPYAPDAWIEEKKTKVGYEIPFTRYFYKYVPPKPSEDIMAEIKELEKSLDGVLEGIFND